MTTRSPRSPGALLEGLLVAAFLSGPLLLSAFSAAAPDGPGRKAPAGKIVAERDAAPQPPRLGKLFRVLLPITGQTTDRLRQPARRALEEARAQEAKAVLIFEFLVPKAQSKFGAGSEFGNALNLARFLSGDELSAATTVAYIPQTIQGHAVLAALACDEIIMAPDAEIGPAGVDEKAITDEVRAAYRSIAKRRLKFPEEVAVKLVDADRELLEVTTDVGTEYVTPDGLKDLAARRTITSKEVLLRAGIPGRFSGTEARQKGFIGYTASSRREVADALDLPPETVQQAFLPEGPLHAVRVDLKGLITRDAVDKAQRMVQEAIRRQEANFVLVWVDSPGGSPGDSTAMANFLALDLDPGRVHTVAYVPREARADAALIALACDEIVLGRDAELGGDGSYRFALGEIVEMTKSVQLICEKKARSWSLPAAIFDPDLAVFRCTKPGQAAPGYYCDAELAQQAPSKRWIKGEQVTPPGKPFLVRGADAARYFPAARIVGDFAELKVSYNLEQDPALLESGWVDALVDVLTAPAVRILLLVIGFVALYIELHSPGIGVPGFLATVCFVLFFWSQFGRTAGWLEVALFLAGLTCLLLELFVIPGFGIFGLGGGVMILASLILASQTFVVPRNPYELAQFQKSLLVVGASIAGIIGAIALLNRWLPETPLLGQMVLNPPSGDEAEAIDSSAALTHFEDLLGMRGATTTPLVPGGKARIGKNLYDVMTDGEFVPRNAEVEVVEIRGNWIVVRPIDAES